MRLEDLVRDRTFSAGNPRHRRALLEDEFSLPPDDPRAEILARIVVNCRATYPSRSWSAPLAQSFEAIVKRSRF